MDEKLTQDKKFIALALNLSKKHLGLTAPSPVVGCVITKDDEILATGITAPGGRPHAEAVAISNLKDPAITTAATIYITLEPCCHKGRGEACLDLILQHRFKRVVIATLDPDLRVNGQSIARLKQENIELVVGVLEKEAKELNKGFFNAKQNNLPFVTLKIAASLDGKIATANYDSKWISSEKSRQYAHYLRAQNDAIMIGGGTLRHDNPYLNVRIAGYEDHKVKRVIISRSLDFSSDLQIFENSDNPTIILTSKINEVQDLSKYEKNAEIIFCEEKNGKIILAKALQKLCQKDINSILIEGGQNLATQFLQENLVDEFIYIQSNKIIGSDGISAFGPLGLVKVEDALKNLALKDTKIIDGDLVSVYRKL